MAGRLRRWWWRSVLACAALVLLWLGRGLGLHGSSSGVAAGEPAGAAAGSAVGSVTGTLAGSVAGSDAGRGDGPSANGAAAASANGANAPTEVHAAPPAVAPPVPIVEPAPVLDDRGAAIASVVRRALAQGRVAAADRSLRALRNERGARVPAELDALAAAVEQARTSTFATLCSAIGEGEIGAAERQLQTLLDGDDGSTAAWLQQAAAARGWPALLGAGRAPTNVPAAPFGGDRAVRWWSDDRLERSRVVALADGHATLRLVSSRGVTFPSVPLAQLEPDAPTATEAVALGLWSLAADQPQRARLWCACALGRGADAALAAPLRDLLP